MATNPRIGTVVAGYRIESPIGRGGMSVVYLAHHEGLERKAALKLLRPSSPRTTRSASGSSASRASPAWTIRT
jgi:serine/threonine protein kinase